MANRSATIMKAQFKKATASADTYLKFMMSEEDLKTWYILISNIDGDDGEFAGGEYLVRVVAPDDFPMNPPSFYFMTPNGVYDVEKKVCISIGEYHKDQYRASLGMAGFASQLCSGLIGWRTLGSGINLIETTVKEKKKLAQESVEYNSQHAELVAMIKSCYESYSAAWKK